ncbi:hypothetical protein T06_6866, partial [Trichinella sp. T6]
MQLDNQDIARPPILFFIYFTPQCLSFASANFRLEVCISKNQHRPIHKERCHTVKCTNHNDKYGL